MNNKYKKVYKFVNNWVSYIKNIKKLLLKSNNFDIIIIQNKPTLFWWVYFVNTSKFNSTGILIKTLYWDNLEDVLFIC